MENASGRMQRAIRGGWMSCGGGVVGVERGVQEKDYGSLMAMKRCERRVVRVCDSVAMNAVQCRVAVWPCGRVPVCGLRCGAWCTWPVDGVRGTGRLVCRLGLVDLV